MKRQRQWKDRRSWNEAEAKAKMKKYPAYPWWRVIIGFFVPKRAKKWRKAYIHKKEAAYRYVIKKMAHNTSKNEPGEWQRIQNQADRKARKHFLWLYHNRPFEAGSFFAGMSKRNKGLLSDYMERIAASTKQALGA